MSLLKKYVNHILLCLILVISAYNISASPSPSQSYQIKAVFLFNFAHFVNWPDSSFESAESPFIIAIYGEDPFGSYLQEVVSGESINGHPMVIKRIDSPEDINACHILYINQKNGENAEKMLKKTFSRNILTVSDKPGFMLKGGMVKFITESKKIRFQINPEAIKATEMSISSKLLGLAVIFDPNNRK